MQEKLSVALSGKDATKLLEGLLKDPQLRADDDPSVGKLVAAHGYRQKRENKLEIKKWEMREEGENSNELSLHLCFKLSFLIGLN